MTPSIESRAASRKANDHPCRDLGRIYPTKNGNTTEANREIADQTHVAFREAVLHISSFMRASYDLDPADFFSDLRNLVKEWEEEHKANPDMIVRRH